MYEKVLGLLQLSQLLNLGSRLIEWVEMCLKLFYHPASLANREVANLTERKNLHTPVYGVKEFVCLSVTNFDPNYLTGRTEWAEIFKDNFGWTKILKKFIP